MKKTLILALGLMIVLCAAGVSALECGSTITADTILEADMPCLGNAITIDADNIVLDCAGHSITGDGSGNGIYLSSRTGVTVKNCVVTNFGAGITLESSSYNTLTGNTANDNAFRGIDIESSSNNNNLTGNTANNNANDSLANIQSIKDTIINLRIQSGEGSSDGDFQDVYPYFPISPEEQNPPIQ